MWGGQWAYLTYFYLLAICTPKIIKFIEDLMKHWQKQVGSFFGIPCISDLYSEHCSYSGKISTAIIPSDAAFLPVIVFGLLAPALNGRDLTVSGGRGIGNKCGLDIVIEVGARLSRRWRKPPDWTTGLCALTAAETGNWTCTNTAVYENADQIQIWLIFYILFLHYTV